MDPSNPRDLSQRDWGDRARSALPPELDPRRGGRAAAPAGPATAPAGRTTGPAARALGWLAGALSLVVLTASSGGWVAVRHYGNQFERLPYLPVTQEAAEERETEARNYLLIGSDSRDGLEAGEGVQGRGDEFVVGERSDTTIIAHIGRDGRFVQFLSFPRDAWVTIPAHTNREGEQVEEREAKLNTAFQEGGAPLLVQTLNRLTGIYIDGVVKVDFDGFTAIVNALGGVEVCLPEPAKEKDSGIDLPAGVSRVDGDQALAYVRQRKGLRRGDLDRIQRQQQFLGAVVREAADAGTLTNPRELNRLGKAITGAITLDEDMSTGDLMEIARRLRPEKVVFSTPPVSDSNATRQRQSVVLLDAAAAEPLYRQVRLDQDPTAPDEPGTAPAGPPPVPTDLIVAPDRIRVNVFNGAGVQGLGRKAAADLAAVGFNVLGTPENRGSGAAETVVLHGPDRADSARTLAAAILPGATTRLDPSLGRTLQVVVGASYSGTRQVTVRPRPAAPAGTPATSAPPVTAAAQDPCAV